MGSSLHSEYGPLANVLACEGKPGQKQLKTDVKFVY